MKVWLKLPDESPTPEKVMIAKGEGTLIVGERMRTRGSL